MNQTTIAETFVEFADTLTADFDVVDFLHQVAVKCADVLGVAAAGLLLTDQRGALRVVAASSERTRLLELLQLQHDEGPCPESFHTGRPIAVPDLAAETGRWPRFATAATAAGFASVEALPMRLRDTVIGALGLFGTRPGPLDPVTLRLARALGDVATIGIVQARTIQRQEEIAAQLQTALTSRVAIEQAKGVIAERHDLDMDGSFELLRRAARSANRRLSDLARDVVTGEATV
ncbi:transcriptional regulator [Actinorhabdospora filicis]|uniref:Transcriptional regulator n=1 Tax=Actinorhabdospora filicis TaxID=1785913 RepID=A0A9W6W0V8_9ACTN|nr:GAF and ANTAR domain-containing protein [Actinorhabdospora filicis]GLZ75202.1 transcriptional regulator [Actinorhabdospora filicis]